MLFTEAEMIRTVDHIDEPWVSDELEGDLKRLFREAKEKKDPKSQKIVANLDDWLRNEL